MSVKIKFKIMLEYIANYDPFERGIMGTINWDDFQLSQVEVYWEYFDNHAGETMHRLGRLAEESTRNNEVRFYEPYSQRDRARTLAANRISMPLPPCRISLPLTQQQTKKLSIYEKTENRLRFEVKHKQIRSNILNRVRGSEARLNGLFTEISSEAAQDIENCWNRFWEFLERSDVCDRPDFLLRDINQSIYVASNICGLEYDPEILSCLLRDGSVTATQENSIVSPDLCAELVRQGVLVHLRFLRREPRDENRRYTLSDRFQPLRSALGGDASFVAHGTSNSAGEA